MKWLNGFLLVAIACLWLSCGTGPVAEKARDDLYRPTFMADMEKVKTLFKAGKSKEAVKALFAVQDKTLAPTEAAYKYNLAGTLFFAKGKYKSALKYFSESAQKKGEDPALLTQLHFNLASTHFKLANFETAYGFAHKVNVDLLKDDERSNYWRLTSALSLQLGKSDEAVNAMVQLLSGYGSVAEIEKDVLGPRLVEAYLKLSEKDRMTLLDEHRQGERVVVAYLAFKDAEARFSSGKPSEAKELLNWIKDHFPAANELQVKSQEFLARMENVAKLDQGSIGIVLPLSGSRRVFAERALRGIDFSLRELKDANVTLSLFPRDSQGSASTGAFQVKELIEKQFVSVVIGGLFPNEAQEEYLEAKRHGTLFISLSPVYLPKEEKNHLLIEVPGSIESQMASLFAPAMLETMGKRAAIIYPETPLGQAYAAEFSRAASESKVTLSGAQSFPDKSIDFRVPVEKLLGLHYKRERKEETDLWNGVVALEGSKSVRRLQVLPPVVDFDWVFIPAAPQETLQIIPLFRYYDASNVVFVGGPNWRTNRVMSQGPKLGRLVFLGDDVAMSDSFQARYNEHYGQPPKIIEAMAFDSLKIASQLVGGSRLSGRFDLERLVLEKGEVQGISGTWKTAGGIWLKTILPFKIQKERIEKMM